MSRIVAIDLGAYSIKVGVFAPAGQGLCVESFVSTPLGIDPAHEDQRNAAITQVLKSMLGGVDIKKASCVFTVSGQSVFTRFVKLLPGVTSQEQIQQTIQFEAAQNVPFPLSEVVWDYQLTQTPAGETEAIIVAIKAEILDRLNQSVMEAGCLPQQTDVAPLALFNAVRFNYPEEEGCILLLDIGAKTTQLVFIEKNRLFVRGVPIAGNQITQAIATDLGCEFAEAEAIKHEKGFVGLGGAYEDPPDPIAARSSKIIRQVMTRLHQEVNRSIISYKNQQGGSAPTRILLGGGSSVLAYMDLFFGDKLNLPVEYFNPLRNMAVSSEADVDGLSCSAYTMGEVIGLALRQIGECPLEVNLTPASVRAQVTAKSQIGTQVAAVGVLAALFAVMSFATFQKKAQVEVALDCKASELQKLKSENVQLKSEQELFEKKLLVTNKAEALGRDLLVWPTILNELNQIVPVGVWITSLTPSVGDASIPCMVAPPVEEPAADSKKNARSAPPKKPQKVTPTEITHIVLEGYYEAYKPELLQFKEEGADGDQAIADFLQKLTSSQVFNMTSADTANPKFVERELPSAAEEKLALQFKIVVPLRESIALYP